MENRCRPSFCRRIALGAALAMGSAAVTYAQAPTVIYACVKTDGVHDADDGRLVRIVDATQPCKPNETRLYWNLTGPQGPAGPTGPMGPQGATGPQGPAGASGAQGVKGDTGQNGSQGPAGPTGAQGVKGDTGGIGATGPTGATGAQGTQGPQGALGPAGASGAQGPTGQTGASGATGAQGPAGEAGDGIQPSAQAYGTVAGDNCPSGSGHAYDIENYAGPVLTRSVICDGATGPQGPAGHDGSTGLQGPQGPAGLQGLQGLAGPQGPAGSILVGAQNLAPAMNASPYLTSNLTFQTLNGSGFPGTTHGYPLLIQVSVPLYNNGNVACQPAVDGKWAGVYAFPLINPADPMKDMFLANNGFATWSSARIYTNIPSGNHQFTIQCWAAGTVYIPTPNTLVSMSVFELD